MSGRWRLDPLAAVVQQPSLPSSLSLQPYARHQASTPRASPLLFASGASILRDTSCLEPSKPDQQAAYRESSLLVVSAGPPNLPLQTVQRSGPPLLHHTPSPPPVRVWLLESGPHQEVVDLGSAPEFRAIRHPETPDTASPGRWELRVRAYPRRPCCTAIIPHPSPRRRAIIFVLRQSKLPLRPPTW